MNNYISNIAIPNSWNFVKIKFLVDIHTGNSLNDDLKIKFESEDSNHLPYIGSKDISASNYSVNYSNGLRIPKSESKFKVAQAGSFLLCIEGGSAGKKIAFLEQDVTYVNKLACFHYKNKFLYFFAQSKLFKDQFFYSISGMIGGVSKKSLSNFYVTLPPQILQTQIAKYLDYQTNIIDQLIEKKEKFVALLHEQRQAMINEAVTKGLDPNAKMKDSGIEWLREIPEDWSINKVKNLFEFKGGGTPSKSVDEYWDKGDIPWVSPKDMKRKWINESQDYITEAGLKNSTTSLVANNSLLMVFRSGILQRTIPIAINQTPVTINQDIKALSSKGDIRIEYMYFFILSNEINLLKEWMKNGATVESLELSFVKEFKMPLPSIKEQDQIVNFLTNKINSLESASQKLNIQIQKLKEYRQSIISEAVTGKIDLREWNVPKKENT